MSNKFIGVVRNGRLGGHINNRLTMGRLRWLIYAVNAERRRSKDEEERRPGARPLTGRGEA